MKRKLSKVAIGLIALAVQLLPSKAEAMRCCIELPSGLEICVYCPDGADCEFELLGNGNYRIMCI